MGRMCTAQLMAFALFTLCLAGVRGYLTPEQIKGYLADLQEILDAVHDVIQTKDEVRYFRISIRIGAF